jgi:hypothetical protein
MKCAWDNVAAPVRAVTHPRGEVTTASIKRLGARAKHGMANRSEPLLNVVIDKSQRC